MMFSFIFVYYDHDVQQTKKFRRSNETRNANKKNNHFRQNQNSNSQRQNSNSSQFNQQRKNLSILQYNCKNSKNNVMTTFLKNFNVLKHDIITIQKS